MIVRPTNIDVRADVVALNHHSHVEEVERLLEAALALERVAHVIEQLGIAVVHLQSRHEYLILVHPVVVPHIRLGCVRRQQQAQQDY